MLRPDEQLKQEFEDRCARLGDLGPVVENLLRQLLHVADIRTHSISHRVKSWRSLERKLGEKGAEYSSLEDVHDILGVRVITFFPDEVDAVAEVIEREFDPDRPNSVDKRAVLDPDRFGYLSLHYVVQLSDARRRLTEHRRFAEDKFEIQVRSILQHAWAEIEHDLGYQAEPEIPRPLRRRFSRLAGLLEMGDEEFAGIRDALTAYTASLGEAIRKNPDETSLDRDSLAKFVEESALVRALDAHVAKATGCEFGPLDAGYVGRRATALQSLGFTSIGAVSEALTEKQETIRRFMSAWLADLDLDNVALSPGISLFYLGYVAAAERGPEPLFAYLEGLELSDVSSTAERVLKTYRQVSKAKSAKDD